MKQGTTQAILFSVDADLSLVDNIIFTFTNENKQVILQKTYNIDDPLQNGKIVIPLTQEETILFSGKFLVEGQINFSN